uniref:Ovule protein n=1 Tax=Brugia timori TaxID=42155 RepID=A0A0R3QZ13_9BILA
LNSILLFIYCLVCCFFFYISFIMVHQTDGVTCKAFLFMRKIFDKLC